MSEGVGASIDTGRVSGTVEGGVQAQDLAVEATANIAGDVVYERIRIAAGGVVQGSLKWKGADQAEGSRLKLVASPDEKSSKAIWIE